LAANNCTLAKEIPVNICISPRRFAGTFKIPASKSHTIRRLLIASLADGVSEIKYPLDSLDTRSCLAACSAFGAEITEQRADNNELISWKIRGGFKNFPELQKNDISSCGQEFDSLQINVGNSGTTLFLALAAAALQPQPIQFIGDEQLQRRSAAPLLDALKSLGVHVQSNNGCVPVTIKGPLTGGRVCLPCPTSQYLSALLIALPLAPAGTVSKIEVPLLNEKPYVEMTLSYLKAHDIPYEAAPDFSNFTIPGGSSWKAFSGSVPADFSSAAFPAAAAAITGGPVTLLGLDPEDTQGDKVFFDILTKMGCFVCWQKLNDGYSVTISRERPLCGGVFDLNDTPDLLPAAVAVAAYAQGDTSFVNVAHARIKETDRIAVMAQELAKLGVRCTELPDGLVVHGSGKVEKALFSPDFPVIEGHGDHRVVMAFAAAALGSPVPVEITTAESANITYPGFLALINAIETVAFPECQI
jgi:3-phosphoshikimate 1-carboxyvinyltransferase